MNDRGFMGLTKIFNFIFIIIIYYAFINMWAPLLGIYNFDLIAYGTVVEIFLNLVPLLIIIAIVAVEFNKLGKNE